MSYSCKAIGTNHSPLALSPLSTESKQGIEEAERNRQRQQ